MGNRFGGDVASDINAVKARRVKAGQRRVELANGALHAFDLLVNQGVAANELADFFDAAVVGHQLGGCGHVNAIHIGEAHRGSGAGQVDLARTRVTGHLHNFAAGGAAHDGVVHQQHIAALELAGYHVELLPHRFFAHTLPRHDESAAHVAVFHKCLAVGDAQQVRQLGGAGAAGFRNGDDHVNLVGRHGGDDALGQGLAQVQAGLVDRDAVQHRVGPGEVNKFKNTGLELRACGAHLRMHLALQVHKHSFSGLDVALIAVARAFQSHGLAGHHHGVLAAAQAQGANAKGVSEGQQAVAGDQRHHGIRALDALVHAAHGFKHVLRLERQATGGFFQLVGQHIEQDLGVALGVYVAVVVEEQHGLECDRVGEVAVVHHHNAKGRVHVKRLGFFFAEGISRRGVAHLAQAHVARQPAHVAGAKNISDHALGLVHEKLAVLLRGNAGRILTPVLQEQQAVVDQLVNWGAADNANDSAHVV